MDEQTRFSACLLVLMDADLEARAESKTRRDCARVRDDLRDRLARAALERECADGPLIIEDYENLSAEMQSATPVDAIGLLVELCAAAPWAEAKGSPALNPVARETLLGQLAIDLPGESDEDDVEYADEALKEGRELSGWSTARWALVIGGGLIAVVATGGVAGVALVGGAGGLTAAGGVTAAVAAVGAAGAAEIAVAVAATVVGGVGGAFGATVLSSDMSTDAVDVAVVKRFALVRMLRRFPALTLAAQERFDELVRTRDELARERAGELADDRRKELGLKVKSFDRAIERLKR